MPALPEPVKGEHSSTHTIHTSEQQRYDTSKEVWIRYLQGEGSGLQKLPCLSAGSIPRRRRACEFFEEFQYFFE